MRHYFFNYILKSFETLIPIYLFEHLEEHLGDAEWREDNIMHMRMLRLWERHGEDVKSNWERSQEIEVGNFVITANFEAWSERRCGHIGGL